MIHHLSHCSRCGQFVKAKRRYFRSNGHLVMFGPVCVVRPKPFPIVPLVDDRSCVLCAHFSVGYLDADTGLCGFLVNDFGSFQRSCVVRASFLCDSFLPVSGGDL